MLRSEQSRAAWRRLTPNQRRILVSHRRDELERDEALRRSVFTALECVYGPREWSAGDARVAEGDSDGERPREPPYAMTLAEIGEVLGVSKERVREIIKGALAKLRHPSILSLLGEEPTRSHGIDSALATVESERERWTTQARATVAKYAARRQSVPRDVADRLLAEAKRLGIG